MGEVVRLSGGTVTLEEAVDAYLEYQDLARSPGGSSGPRSPAWPLAWARRPRLASYRA